MTTHANESVPPPITLVILGASGDLTHRLLLPGLGTLLRAKPAYDVHLVGAAAADMTADEWRDRVRGGLEEGGCRRQRADDMAAASTFVHLDVTDPKEMQTFLDAQAAQGRPIVLYFALPPAVTQKSIGVLSGLNLPPDIRLALEKPFGSSLATAKELNALLAGFIPEDRLFRVDHYLGKATVLNLLGLRFGNRIFEPVWNAANIERVEIIADEALALEGRAGYYDHAGALKDMIQSHLMLVMAIFAMEQPARIDAVELRDLIVHTLRSTRLWAGEGERSSHRARYTAGSIDGRQVPDYVAEPGVDPERMTETLAQVTLEIHNARWAGVPFRLRSGKALGDGFRGIVVQFRPVAHLPVGFHNEAAPNVLVIGFTPETLALRVTTNAEGDRWDLETSTLSTQLGESPVRPYGEILDEILTGNMLLGVRGDMAEESWRILDPLLQEWADGVVPMDSYSAGSYGPQAWNDAPGA
ncbi:glucose-6-phosphate dehydrogenase [Propioniciclava coleopterorum]|uniref:Glucose-6-phosphate dehydrogenase n=1 Tax=Propioniciclava coleopterorum TaxID=2714937 RepID=A0A6G7Y6Y1_9ACTN|nr:glucose-6-phosphate dehydrogenase [Propioniciclava coleopterorum]QIK72572.1 glucose-6-phosphate dehydrogenase [Propioniciclava coleopterorum]